MFNLTLALMFIVVTGVATMSARTWISAFDSASTRVAKQSLNKSAEIWILYDANINSYTGEAALP